MIKIEIGALTLTHQADVQKLEIELITNLEMLKHDIMRVKIMLFLSSVKNSTMAIYSGGNEPLFGINAYAYDVDSNTFNFLRETAMSCMQYDCLEVRANYLKIVG